MVDEGILRSSSCGEEGVLGRGEEGAERSEGVGGEV